MAGKLLGRGRGVPPGHFGKLGSLPRDSPSLRCTGVCSLQVRRLYFLERFAAWRLWLADIPSSQSTVSSLERSVSQALQKHYLATGRLSGAGNNLAAYTVWAYEGRNRLVVTLCRVLWAQDSFPGRYFCKRNRCCDGRERTQGSQNSIVNSPHHNRYGKVPVTLLVRPVGGYIALAGLIFKTWMVSVMALKTPVTFTCLPTYLATST